MFKCKKVNHLVQSVQIFTFTRNQFRSFWSSKSIKYWTKNQVKSLTHWELINVYNNFSLHWTNKCSSSFETILPLNHFPWFLLFNNVSTDFSSQHLRWFTIIDFWTILMLKGWVSFELNLFFSLMIRVFLLSIGSIMMKT